MAPVMIDTSAWILYFQNTQSATVGAIDALIDHERDLAVCGPILMEMIQGCRSPKAVGEINEYFSDLLYIQTTEDIYLNSAMMYRQLRGRGITIRKSLDCLIATIAIQAGCELLADDKDFENIAKYTQLKLIH